MTDNLHSFFPPSGAAAWSKCAQWPAMNQRFPQPESAEALEGTAAHEVAWSILSGGAYKLGDKTSNGSIVTDEMLEGGELVADTVRERMKLVDGDCHIEEKVEIAPIHLKCFGTPDYWGFRPANCHLEIVDYKFGHRFVDEYFNLQGISYTAGILQTLFAKYPTIGNGATISFTIVQPRCYTRGASVRTHSFYLSEARPYIQQLRDMTVEACKPLPVAMTNPHCGDCPGRHACSALQEAAYADAEYSSARTPLELTPLAAGLELRLLMRALARLEARVDGLKELTSSNIRNGKVVPYFRVEQGYGRTQWKIPNDQVIAIGRLFGQDLAKQPDVITPVQAKKLGVDESVIQEFSFTPSTSFKLVPQTPTDAPRVFGHSDDLIQF
jgi:hypothetical protein